MAERLLVGYVTQDSFRTVRVNSVLGRDFDQQDFRTRDGGTALITYRLWRERYDASPAVVGRSIALDGLDLWMGPRATAVRTPTSGGQATRTSGTDTSHHGSLRQPG